MSTKHQVYVNFTLFWNVMKEINVKINMFLYYNSDSFQSKLKSNVRDHIDRIQIEQKHTSLCDEGFESNF